MKEKVLTTVVTFETTTQAIAMERECKKNKFTGRLIPVPREISASCGLAWKCGVQYYVDSYCYMNELDLDYDLFFMNSQYFYR